MDAAIWPQIGFVKAMEHMVSNPTCNKPMLERRARPQQEHLNCPRCNSSNTKFCYYNNYSLTQPRYFCKTCRRYWTEGGSLRNVPVGGGSRKNRRPSSSSSSASSASSALTSKLPDLSPPNLSHFSIHHDDHQNPKTQKRQDLNLAFPPMQDCSHGSVSQYLFQMPKIETNNSSSSSSTSFASSPVSALKLLRSGIESRGLSTFIPVAPMPDLNPVMYSSSSRGFNSLQDYKPTLSFSIDHHGFGNKPAAIHGVDQENINNNGGRLFFPFGEMRQQLSSTTTTEVDHHQNKGQGASNGYWNGMLGGGPW